MAEYINQHGWLYRVMERSGKYRARYQMPGQSTWWGSNHVIPRETEAEAEADLCRVVKTQGWKVVKE